MHDFERYAEKASARRTESVTLGRDREPSSASGTAADRPRMLDATSILRLQRAAGNAGVVQLLADEDGGAAIAQRQMPEEEEEEVPAE